MLVERWKTKVTDDSSLKFQSSQYLWTWISRAKYITISSKSRVNLDDSFVQCAENKSKTDTIQKRRKDTVRLQPSCILHS